MLTYYNRWTKFKHNRKNVFAAKSEKVSASIVERMANTITPVTWEISLGFTFSYSLWSILRGCKSVTDCADLIVNNRLTSHHTTRLNSTRLFHIALSDRTQKNSFVESCWSHHVWWYDHLTTKQFVIEFSTIGASCKVLNISELVLSSRATLTTQLIWTVEITKMFRTSNVAAINILAHQCLLLSTECCELRALLLTLRLLFIHSTNRSPWWLLLGSVSRKCDYIVYYS